MTTTIAPPDLPTFARVGDWHWTTAASSEWASDHGVRPLNGVLNCPHGAYLMRMCPSLRGCGMGSTSVLDHARWWAPLDGLGSPFLLAHTYLDNGPSLAEHVEEIARHHGMNVTIGADWNGDDWYGHGTTPIRLELDERAPYPIDFALAEMTGVPL